MDQRVLMNFVSLFVHGGYESLLLGEPLIEAVNAIIEGPNGERIAL